MASEFNLDEFKCALSDDQHFFIDPIPLIKCGHYVCKECIKETENKAKCKICGITTDFDFSTAQVSKALKQSMKLLFAHIFEHLEETISSKLEYLKNFFHNQNELLEINLKYIEDEINIRIESVKIQLEEAGDKLKNELYKIKNEFIKHDNDGCLSKPDLKRFELTLQEIQMNIKDKTNFDDKNLSKYQTSIKQLNTLINENDQTLSKLIDLKVSNDKISEDIIGKLLFKSNKANVENLMLNGKQTTLNLNFHPWDILKLFNKQILSCNFDEECLSVYDNDFNLIKKIDKINGDSIKPHGIAIDQEIKTLFISEIKQHRIFKTDLEFNIIKSIGSKVSEYNQFNVPLGICLNNNYLYVCDNHNRRVQKFSTDFEFVSSLKVDYKPWTIKASNFVLCVSSASPSGLYFYNLKDLSFNQKFDHDYCRISEIDSCFYEFNYKSKILYCYDENGVLKTTVLVKIEEQLLQGDSDGTILNFDGELLMTLKISKKLIKFSTN